MAPAITSELHDIHHAETKAAARVALTVFTEKYRAISAPPLPA